MKILLTGASSFTGFWFAQALAEAGHEVVAPLKGSADSYQSSVRGERVAALSKIADIVFDASFGGPRFLEVVGAQRFDVLCHHAAVVTGYREETFDIHGALAENTNNLPQVLRSLQGQGLRRVVTTGSVFEQDEGAGDEPLRAFSPYGVSKGLTADVFRFWAERLQIPLGKFVIPNPFGPFEEPRFCSYLVNTWKSGKPASVKTPDYIRDNIHADLLARAYRHFAAGEWNGAFTRLNPSGYIESQREFASRVSRAFSQRSGLECALQFEQQTDFSEPLRRVNLHPVTEYVSGWDEAKSWDAFASYYLRQA